MPLPMWLQLAVVIVVGILYARREWRAARRGPDVYDARPYDEARLTREGWRF